MSLDLQQRLDRIRAQKSSKLQNQSRLALILETVDESLDQSSHESTAAAYFVSFLSLLDQNETLNSVVYLLDVICPFVSENLLKGKFQQIVQRLGPLLDVKEDAALTKSTLGVLETVLKAQDAQTWAVSQVQMGPKRVITGLMAIGTDPRPKVRRRAQEAVSAVLSQKLPPRLEHPAADQCAEIVLNSLGSQLSQYNPRKTDNAGLIHTLQLAKAVAKAGQWPLARVEELIVALLQLCKSTDQYLVVAAFNVFESLCHNIKVTDRLTSVITAILDLKPSPQDQHVAPAWLAVLAQACSRCAQLDQQVIFSRLPVFVGYVCEFLKADDTSEAVHVSACECLLALFSNCIPESELSTSNGTNQTLTELGQIVLSLFHIQYFKIWRHSCKVLVALFDTLKWASSPYLVSAFKVIGTLRCEESFSEKEACDGVIAAAIRWFGPELVLQVLPLDIDPGKSENTGRAWLLPLLRENIFNSSLAQFSGYFVSLSNSIQEQVAKMDPKKAGVQIKVYEALNDQIWALLPRYCDLPLDLIDSFTSAFAEFLSNNLYQNPELRPTICLALKTLIQSNLNQLECGDDLLLSRVSQEQAQTNLDYLKSMCQNILSVLFNVYTQTPTESRGYVLETISVFLEIGTADALTGMFNNVCKVLHNSMQENAAMALTMLELIQAMTPHLPETVASTLFTVVDTTIKIEDASLQRKGYKILSKIPAEVISKHVHDVQKLLISTNEIAQSSARGARLDALTVICSGYLGNEDLSFIPQILPETILCTKSNNEKTRESAYNMIVLIGQKMAEEAGFIGGRPVNLTEYFTMMSAGLAGNTPHMISATITALSRAVFEFRTIMNPELLAEVSSTVELFLTSKSREIVKATLGFVKIIVVSLPVEVVEPKLPSLIENLLVWSHEHKAHLRTKVKNIVERLVRRFGYDKVVANFPQSDLKLLTNIRKTRERAKRQIAASQEQQQDGEQQPTKKSAGHASEFDRALYGSDEEDEDSDGEDENEGQIFESDDPMDLMDTKSMARINPQKQKAKKINKFDTDKSGRIMVKEDSKDDESLLQELEAQKAIDAYVTAIKNGPVRGQRGKLKYKRGRKNQGGDDDSDDDRAPSRPAPKVGGQHSRINKKRPNKPHRRQL